MYQDLYSTAHSVTGVIVHIFHLFTLISVHQLNESHYYQEIFFLLLLHEEEQVILALSFLPTHTILPVLPSPPSTLMTCSVMLTTTDLYLWNRKTEASIITQTYLEEDRAEHLVLLLGSSYNSICFVWTPSESHIF